MPDRATAEAKDLWVDILQRAANGYLEGAHDPKQSKSRRRQPDLLQAAARVFVRDGILFPPGSET